nr:STAS domain-containing protein [Streptomyces finlayi]
MAELHGEIDLQSAPEVQDHLDAVIASTGAQMAVDLRRALFLDCIALALLCRAHRHSTEHCGQLHLLRTRPGTARSWTPPGCAPGSTPSALSKKPPRTADSGRPGSA